MRERSSDWGGEVEVRCLQASTEGWQRRAHHSSDRHMRVKSTAGFSAEELEGGKGKRHGSINLAQLAEARSWSTHLSIKARFLQAQKLNF